MALLWGTPAGRPAAKTGPKPALSVDLIVEAAVAIADAETLAGVSMRTVGERLGRTSMALYTYVPGKDVLLDLMYDRVHAEIPVEPELGEGWRPAAETWARDLLAFYLRHPWTLQISYARPVFGPHEQSVLDALARILFATGLPAPRLRGIAAALYHHVAGSAKTAAESGLAATVTGVPDEQWWTRRAEALARVAPDFTERFPHAVRLNAEDVAGDWRDRLEDGFAIGLAVILDGAAPPHA
ncbi:TetR family transcriptional regulator [Phytomonospora endophytica]|nr:TetR family transcriptional regulator [Phytomonospora endophytica]